MDLIIYHSDCSDGFCAAYIASKRWPEAALLPRTYNVEPPYEEVKDRDVLVVDFSWRTREETDKLAHLAKSFHILDHHKSAQFVLAGAPYATFDMNRSGAGLTWDYIFGIDKEKLGFEPDLPSKTGLTPSLWIAASMSKDRPRPWYVNYIEDYDLWKHQLPNSAAINAYLHTQPHVPAVWDANVRGVNESTAALYGAGCLRQIEDAYIRSTVKYVSQGHLFFVDEKGFVHEYSAAVVNAPYSCNSDLLEVMNRTISTDIAMSWFDRGDGKMHISLATIRPDIDVSVLAMSKGGGGHRTKAGIQIPLDEGRTLIDSVLGRRVGGEEDRVFTASKKP